MFLLGVSLDSSLTVMGFSELKRRPYGAPKLQTTRFRSPELGRLKSVVAKGVVAEGP